MRQTDEVGDVLRPCSGRVQVARPAPQPLESKGEEEGAADVTPLVTHERASAETKRPPMRNATRDRNSAELKALRGEADALERQRDLLLLKRKHKAALAFPEGVVSRWKSAAATERASLERAQSENERLAAMLRQQLTLSSVLEAHLRKRQRRGSESEGFLAGPHPVRSPRSSGRNHDTSLGMLQAQFSRDIQRIYKAGIDRIFTGHDWTAASAEVGQPAVREDKLDEITGAPMVVLRETRHIPFEYQRVANAMWRCAMQPFIEEGRLLESYESSENQIAFRYRAVTPAKRDRGDLLTAVMVMQKFEEADRTVHIWRIISSSTEEHTRASQRAFSDETGWFIIEPVPPDVPDIEAGTALVRIVSHHVPLWTHDLTPDNAAGRQLTAGDFHDLIVEAMAEDMVALGDAVGNMLLDESLGITSK